MRRAISVLKKRSGSHEDAIREFQLTAQGLGAGAISTYHGYDPMVDRRCADGFAALLTPLEGIDLSDYERHTLRWLAGREDSTIAVVAALLHRARTAHTLAAQP